MSTTQASRRNAAVVTQGQSEPPQDQRPATAKIGPEAAFGAAMQHREVLDAGGMLALQAAAGNRAVAGLVQARRKRSSMEDSARVHEAAKVGIGGTSGALPHLERIQRSFGRHDVTGVVAHTGAQATAGAQAMGAAAFTRGSHVAFAGSSDLRTAAHEAAHVVQQRAGVQLSGGVGQVGDRYERHADGVAELVVQGRSAEPLLDAHAGGPDLSASASGPRGGGVQRVICKDEEAKKSEQPLDGQKENVFLNDLLERFDDNNKVTTIFIELLEDKKYYTASEVEDELKKKGLKELSPEVQTAKAKRAQEAAELKRQAEETKQAEATRRAEEETRIAEEARIARAARMAEEKKEREAARSRRQAEASTKPPLLVVSMDQGVSGDLTKFTLHSPDFSSCVPIVMYNEANHWGGLFHLPHKGLEGYNDLLESMLMKGRPTQIYVCKGGIITRKPGNGSRSWRQIRGSATASSTKGITGQWTTRTTRLQSASETKVYS